MNFCPNRIESGVLTVIPWYAVIYFNGRLHRPECNLIRISQTCQNAEIIYSRVVGAYVQLIVPPLSANGDVESPHKIYCDHYCANPPEEDYAGVKIGCGVCEYLDWTT